MNRIFFFIFTALFALPTHAEVWSARRQWSPSVEEHYSKWVQSHWHREIFARETRSDGSPNPYYGLRPDCADAVYSMRAIYAYEHGLPFAIMDPTGTGRLISNRMSRFDGIRDPERRMRQFLLFLFGTVSTRSLSNDTFPVSLTPQYVRPGALMKTVLLNHHSWTLKEMLPIGVPWMVFASTVSPTTSLILYQRKSWPNPAWVFEGNQTPASGAGFHNFRPMEHLGRPAWMVPGYSEEQYRIPLDQWVKFAQRRLAVRQESVDQRFDRLMETACQGFLDRIEAVNDGLRTLRAAPQSCMSQSRYDNLSTPNRDQRVFDDLAALRLAFKDAVVSGEANALASNLRRQLEKIFPHVRASAREEARRMRPSRTDSDSVCPISYAPGRTIDLAEAKRRLFAGLMSNNPHDEVDYRWGERAGRSPLAARCPSWDHWSPNLETAN